MEITKTTKVDWTPCDVRNPKKPGFYLVTKILAEDTKPFTCKEYYHPTTGWADNEFGTNVIAWAPKIEPYKPM